MKTLRLELTEIIHVTIHSRNKYIFKNMLRQKFKGYSNNINMKTELVLRLLKIYSQHTIYTSWHFFFYHLTASDPQFWNLTGKRAEWCFLVLVLVFKMSSGGSNSQWADIIYLLCVSLCEYLHAGCGGMTVFDYKVLARAQSIYLLFSLWTEFSS